MTTTPDEQDQDTTTPAAADPSDPTPVTTVRIGSSSAYQFAAQVLGLAVNFAASVLIARTLGPEGKGQLSVLQQVPGILAVLLNFGLAYSNFYFVGRGKQRAGEALGNSLLLAAVVGVIGAPIVWLFTLGPAAVVPDLPTRATAVAALLLPITLVASFAISIGNGLGLLKKASLANMISSGLTLTLLLAAVVLDRLSVTMLLAISVLTGAASLGFVVTAIRPRLGRITVRLAAFRESARYSAKSYFGNLAGYLNYRLDIILVGYLADAASVGVYSIAVTFAELMWYVPNALSTSILAKTMAMNPEDGAEVTARTARLTSLLMLMVCGSAALLIAPIVRIFYGAAFLPAVVPFLLLLPGVWMIGIAKILNGYLAGHGRLYPWVSVLSAVVNLAGNLMLIPEMGPAGAAIASSVSYSLGGAWSLYAFARLTQTRLAHVIIPRPVDLQSIGESADSYFRALRAH